VFNVVCGNPPIAKTSNGTLYGTTMPTRLGRSIYAFLGIPYATPPLQKLRFKVNLFYFLNARLSDSIEFD